MIKLSELEVGVKGRRQPSHVIESRDVYDVISGENNINRCKIVHKPSTKYAAIRPGHVLTVLTLA